MRVCSILVLKNRMEIKCEKHRALKVFTFAFLSIPQMYSLFIHTCNRELNFFYTYVHLMNMSPYLVISRHRYVCTENCLYVKTRLWIFIQLPSRVCLEICASSCYSVEFSMSCTDSTAPIEQPAVFT